MKLTEQIYLVGSGRNGIYLTDESDCNCYLVKLGTTWILFDCGTGIHPEKIEEEIRRDGLEPEQIAWLFLTHCHGDHAGGAFYFREKYGIKVAAPKKEADALERGDEKMLGLDVARHAGYYPDWYHISPCTVDERIEPGVWEQNDIFLNIFEASGHSLGGVCYSGMLEGKRFLISGDMISQDGKISFQLIPGADIHAYARSVREISKVPADLLLPGHGVFQLRDGGYWMRKAAEAFGKLYIPC